jgi:hypothetical protein
MMMVNIVVGYNASLEPNISSSASDVTNELHFSFSSSDYPSLLSGWVVVIAVAVVLFFFVLLGLLGWSHGR